MYTMSKIENNSPRSNLFLILLHSLCLSIALLAAAVKFVVNFRYLYYFDVNHLDIPKSSGFPKDEIIKNYDALINYMKTSFKGELKFPTFPMSYGAKFHFVEVKNIFVSFDYILIGGLAIAFVGAVIYLKKRNYSFLKWSAVLLILLPVFLAIPFAINFDASFTAFHKLAFSNDYWLFDPNTDPIINVLPEQFFMHSAVLILILVTAASILMYYIYRKLLKRQRNSYY